MIERRLPFRSAPALRRDRSDRPESANLSRYYVKRLPAALHGPRRILAFAVATSLHAVSHALVALVGSALALSLTLYGATGGLINARPGGPVRAASGASVTAPPFAGLAAAAPAASPAAQPANDAPVARTRVAAAALAVLARSLPGYGDPKNQAVWLAALALVVVFVKGAAGAYATYVQVLVAGRVGCGLRVELFDALLDVHRLRHPRHPDHGAMAPAPMAHAIVSLTERVREVELGLGLGLLGSVRAIAQLVPLAAVLVVLSPAMAGVGGTVLLGFGWTLGRLRTALRAATRRAAREHEHLVAAADECVRHADLWVSYGAEGRAQANVRRLGDAAASGSARLAGNSAVLSATNEALAATALVVALGAARAGWLGGAAEGATFLAFAVAFFLAYRPLRELAEARAAYARAEVAFGDLRPLLEPAPRSDVRPGDRSAAPAIASRPSRASDLSVLSAAGPGRRWPLAELELRELQLAHGAGGVTSLRVPAGVIVVVTGPTGAGKTTLLRTLLGLEAASGGEVLYAGEAIVDAPAGPSARPFAWVPQDAPLLDDTLAANIDLGAPGVDARSCLVPLGAAHLLDALRGRRLGAGGRPASGGERQWIALARAMATRQPVLLLDEPTSGLDPDAQRVVLEAISRLRGERTVILVTHRPEPLGIADLVVPLGRRS